jgi:PPOX class probable F420-dependent enzyme
MQKKSSRVTILLLVTFVIGWGAVLVQAQETTKTLAQFLAERRNVTLATMRANGTPHLSPMWFYWDGEQFYISTTRDRVKYKNLERNPSVSLCIDDVTGLTYVVAEGKAEIRTENIWDDTKKILVKYRGEEGGDAYLERLQKEPRVLIVLKPTRIETRGVTR